MGHQSLKIVIIGAGLGGLMAAFRFAKDGHQVQVYERKPKFEPRGGGIVIRPNASRFLIRWGLENDFEAISDPSAAANYRDGKTSRIIFTRHPASASEYPDWGTIREAAQGVLFRRALDAGAKIEFGVTAATLTEDDTSASIILSTGEIVKADLVLAADGILSRLRSQIVPDAPAPEAGRTTACQIQVPEEKMRHNEQTKWLVQSTDLTVWSVQGGGGYIVGRYNSKTRRWNGIFAMAEADDKNPRMWDEEGDIELVREHFKEWDPSLRAALQIATHCDRWRLGQMPDMKRWRSGGGRLLLLGDSAHAKYPDAAQGFSQIIEDVAVLSHLLSNYNTSNISFLTQSWQDIRLPRENRIKAFAHNNHLLYTSGHESKQNEEQTQLASKYSSFEGSVPRMDANFADPAFLKWVYGTDIIEETKRYMEKQGLSQARL